MTLPYQFNASIQDLITIQPDSTVSRTVFEDETIKIVIFGFAAKQALSEHTSSKSAIIHIISGSAKVTLGEDSYDVQDNAWMQMSPRLPHSILAVTDVVMLLYMMKGTPK